MKAELSEDHTVLSGMLVDDSYVRANSQRNELKGLSQSVFAGVVMFAGRFRNPSPTNECEHDDDGDVGDGLDQ